VEIWGNCIEPGTRNRFPALDKRGFEASCLNMPVFVARGSKPDPTLCVTAAIHGDETNSVEVARRVFAGIDAATLGGMMYRLPMVNADGFRSRNRPSTKGRGGCAYLVGRVDSFFRNCTWERGWKWEHAWVTWSTLSPMKSTLSLRGARA